MLRRRAMLVLSILIATAIHGFLYWFAPEITLGRAITTPTRERVKQLRFHLRQEAPAPPVTAGSGGGETNTGKALSTRPGSVRDLLKREPETLKPDLSPGPIAPVQGIDQRGAQERSAAHPDLAPSEDSLRRADAKIIEIARANARMDLNIARRVVRESPDRFFAPEEFPALRSELGGPMQPLVRFEAPTSDLLQPNATAQMPRELAAPGDTGLLDGEPLEHEQLPLPTEIARAPLAEEKARAVEETPFEFLDDLVNIELQTHRAPGEENAFFRVRVSLRDAAKAPLAPKDVVFLIDASSSMQQRKLDAAVAGVRQCLTTLTKTDRFNVVLFRDSLTSFRPEPVPATEDNLAEAQAFLKKVPARGETDVYNALAATVAAPTALGRGSQLFVFSDGRATTGIKDARQIINRVTNANTPAHTIFAYAAGNAIDRYLLELLAYRNRGAAQFSDRIDDMKTSVPKFFQAYARPVLVNVQADFTGVDTDDIYPRALPDLSAASPYEIYGRFVPARDKELALRLSGRSGDRAKDLVFKVRFDDAQKGTPDLAAGWAFQKSYALIADIAREGETPALLSELRALGNKYKIKTVYSE